MGKPIYKMVKILVYGTLRKGFGNHKHYLKGYKNLGTFRLRGFSLYDLGAYPIVVRDKEGSIVVEQYDICKEDYLKISSMEIGAGYLEGTMKILGDEYKIYFFNWVPYYAIKVDGGDYSLFRK